MCKFQTFPLKIVNKYAAHIKVIFLMDSHFFQTECVEFLFLKTANKLNSTIEESSNTKAQKKLWK